CGIKAGGGVRGGVARRAFAALRPPAPGGPPPFLPRLRYLPRLELARDALVLAPHAQQVAAPELGALLLGGAAADPLERDVERLARVAPAGDAAAAVEVGADADVVDADQLHRVIDVVDEVADRRARPARLDLRDAALVLAAALLRHLRERLAPAAADAELLPGLRQRLALLGRRDLDGRVERGGLHDAAVLLQREELLVGHVARVVGERARARVAGDHRRLGNAHRVHHRGLGDVRDVHHDAEPVHLGDDLLTELAQPIVLGLAVAEVLTRR